MGEGWTLTDYFEPMDGDDANERTPLRSGAEARVELSRFVGLEPRIVMLEGPAGQSLQIGIGGRWAGFARIEPERDGVEGQRVHIALPQVILATEHAVFLRWAQPCTLKPDELFPANEAIELVALFVSTGSFSTHVGWRRC